MYLQRCRELTSGFHGPDLHHRSLKHEFRRTFYPGDGERCAVRVGARGKPAAAKEKNRENRFPHVEVATGQGGFAHTFGRPRTGAAKRFGTKRMGAHSAKLSRA